eukprot:GILK01010447.1.p1 GENE.GILK01010447.1~~GILK01010447.1.p1  ORF type:complete len:252 (+),score=5.41 GILK01010447.1:234-989(+)
MFGPLVYAVILTVGIPLLMPLSIFYLSAGYIFTQQSQSYGLVVAFLSVFVGSFAGAWISFVLGRTIFYNKVSGLTNRWRGFAAFNKAIELKGLQLMVIFRLAPILPFTWFNYVCAVTPVATKHYLIGLLCYGPRLFQAVYFGSLLSSLRAALNGEISWGVTQIVVLVLGILISVVGVIYAGVVSKRYRSHVLPVDDMSDGGLDLPSSSSKSPERTQLLSGTMRSDDLELVFLPNRNHLSAHSVERTTSASA